MTACDQGRQFNSLGVSNWDYSIRMKLEADKRARGWKPSLITAYYAGEAAAMAEVCPEVK